MASLISSIFFTIVFAADLIVLNEPWINSFDLRPVKLDGLIDNDLNFTYRVNN